MLLLQPLYRQLITTLQTHGAVTFTDSGKGYSLFKKNVPLDEREKLVTYTTVVDLPPLQRDLMDFLIAVWHLVSDMIIRHFTLLRRTYHRESTQEQRIEVDGRFFIEQAQPEDLDKPTKTPVRDAGEPLVLITTAERQWIRLKLVNDDVSV